MLPQRLLQESPAPRQAGPNRADRYRQRCGDLAVGEPLYVGHDDHEPIPVRERLDRTDQVLPQDPVQEILLRRPPP